MLRAFANYVFVPYEEAFRAGAIAALAVGAQLLLQTDLGEVADWKTWAIAAGVAIGNAFLAAARGAAKAPAV